MNSSPSNTLSRAEKEELMEQFREKLYINNIQELANKMVEKCFRKCITKPGTSLEGSEQKCLAMCMDRFMDSYTLVLNTFVSRIQRENNAL